MKITEEYGITVLQPDDGYKYVTNGETWSTKVYLGKFDSVDNWHDTNEEPQEEEATEADYQAALNRMGVSTSDEA